MTDSKQDLIEAYLEEANFDLDLEDAAKAFISNDISILDYIEPEDFEDHFTESYIGEYWSEKEVAEVWAEEMGWYDAMESAGINPRYFDAEAFGCDLRCGGDVYLVSVIDGPNTGSYAFRGYI